MKNLTNKIKHQFFDQVLIQVRIQINEEVDDEIWSLIKRPIEDQIVWPVWNEVRYEIHHFYQTDGKLK